MLAPTCVLFTGLLCQTFIQPGAVIKRPGESYKLTCTASGCSLVAIGQLWSDRLLGKDWNRLLALDPALIFTIPSQSREDSPSPDLTPAASCTYTETELYKNTPEENRALQLKLIYGQASATM